MHIVHLIPNLMFGGAQKIAIGLAEEARQRGHDCSMVTVADNSDFSSRLDAGGIRHVSLGCNSTAVLRNIPQLFALRSQLKQIARDLSPDVIHTHLFISRVLLYGMRNLGGCPVVDTQHDNSPWWRKADTRSVVQTHVDRMFLRHTSRYTAAISQSVSDDLQSYFQVPAQKCPLIYNFIDNESGGQQAVRKVVPHRVLVVSRLDMEKKGLDTAVEVFARIYSRLPDAELVIVGDGPDRRKLERLVVEKQIEPAVQFLGFQSNPRKYMAEARVLLMPSRWEGFGLVAAEAAAVGAPVVAGRVGGLQEVVVDGETGFTCDPEDVDAFEKHVFSLLSDDRLYQGISNNARDSVKLRFSRCTAFNAYERLYEAAREAS